MLFKQQCRHMYCRNLADSVRFVIAVGDVKRRKTLSNATNGLLNKSAIFFNNFGIKNCFWFQFGFY